jgi:hypothetical protein
MVVRQVEKVLEITSQWEIASQVEVAATTSETRT